MAAPRVFFSYADDDAFWVNLFRPYFVSVLNTVRIIDCSADSIAYGPLRDALAEQIETAAVVIAFVSENYRKTEWTVAEWEKSLSEIERRRLIFVPIMLDADGTDWWQKLRRDNRLTELNRDYQYADFTIGGAPALPGPENPKIIQMINNLALRVRRDITTPEKPVGGPKGGTGPTIVPDKAQIVVLGHPSASFPPDLEEESQQLIAALGTTIVTWADGWRRKDAARAGVPSEADPVFVQPITDVESADYVEDKAKTNKYLIGLQRPKARVAVWLPARYKDAEFEKAANETIARGGADAQKYPAFRADTPDGLAKWLHVEIGSVTSTGERTVVQVEGMGTDEDVKPENAIAAKLLVDQLRDAVFGIVSRVVDKPPPESPAWQFWASQFGKQIKNIEGSRAIVAVHDLNITPHPDPRIVRKKVEGKFELIQTAVEAEQEQRMKDGKPSLKLFWTALLVNNAGVLPFSNYPDDGRFKDWRLLEFSPVGERGKAVPDPASLAVFRTNLLAWAAEP
jgi:hypothetical protein